MDALGRNWHALDALGCNYHAFDVFRREACAFDVTGLRESHAFDVVSVA
ncbi:hypothetical protein HMPREF1868_01459 [Olsenella sp. DNF00959]|nr:hypothetical protein HMPREF1868_01459 [Olsenella sp. DNF00959]